MSDPKSSSKPEKLDALLCFTLYAATNTFIRAYNARLSPFGLTYEQYVVLQLLWQEGSKRRTAICERLTLDQAAVDSELDRLEQAKLLMRERPADGSDDPCIRLTEDGIGLEGALYDVQHSIACEAEVGEDTNDFIRTELSALMRRMRTRSGE